MRQSTPTWRHFKRPASISCAMNKCEAFKNFAASIVESSCFPIGDGNTGATTGLSVGAGGGGVAITDAGAIEGLGAGARIGTASPSSRSWSR